MSDTTTDTKFDVNKKTISAYELGMAIFCTAVATFFAIHILIMAKGADLPVINDSDVCVAYSANNGECTDKITIGQLIEDARAEAGE